MDIKVYVLINNTNVACYHNLRQLCDDNPTIPYFMARYQLSRKQSTQIGNYLIVVTTIKYNTKRRPSNANTQ
jgi:hypothetical protein